MPSEEETLEKILKIIRFKSKGMTITELSRQTGIHRNSIAKYLQILLASGKVDIQLIGNAKIYTIAKRVPISSMMDCTTDLILIINKEKKIVNVNTNFLDFFGHKKDELFLEKYDRIENPILENKEITELISKGIEDGEKAALEIILEYKSREYDFYINIISMVLDGGGKGILLRIQDFTESMIAERAILESEQKFRNVFNFAFDSIFLYRINEDKIIGDLIEVNDRAIENLNYEPGEMPHLPACKIIEPENWDISTQLEQNLAENYNSIFDGSLIRSDGKKIPVEISSQIFLLNNNLVVLFIVRDITRWKKAQKCLELSEERYRKILETQSEFICRQYPDGTFSYVNDAFCRFCNKKREEIIGNRNILEIFPEDKKIIKDCLKKIDKNNNTVEFEQRIISDTGKDIWLQWRTQVIFNEESEIIEYQSVARDITDNKKAELSLQISEETARILLDENATASILLDTNGNILDHNRKIFEYFSIAIKNNISKNKSSNSEGSNDIEDNSDSINKDDNRASLIGKNFTEIISKEESEDIRQIFNAVKDKKIQGTIKSKYENDVFEYTYYPILSSSSELTKIVIFKNNITKEEKNKEYLQNRIKVLGDIIHSLPDATFALNTDKEVIAWNKGMEKLTGIRKDETDRINKRYSEIFYEGNEELLIENLLNNIENYNGSQKYPEPLSRRCFCPKLNRGQGVDIKCSASYLYDEEGKIYGAIETIADLTRLNKTRDALSKSERKYWSMIEEHSDMICRFSFPERKITFVNSSLCSHFGFEKKELIGKDISNIFPQSICENINNIQNNPVPKIGSSNYETRIVDSTKKTFWQKWTIKPVFNRENSLVSFNCTGRDISQKKEYEYGIQKSGEDYRQFFENADFIVLKTDINGKILYLNKFTEKYFGYNYYEIYNKSFYDYLAADNYDIRAEIKNLYEEIENKPDKQSRTECSIINSGGESIPVIFCFNKIYDMNEKKDILLITGKPYENNKFKNNSDTKNNKTESLKSESPDKAELSENKFIININRNRNNSELLRSATTADNLYEKKIKTKHYDSEYGDLKNIKKNNPDNSKDDSEAIITVDLYGNIALINDKACELIGISESNIIGRDLYSCFPGYMQDTARKIHEKISNRKETNPASLLAQHPDGNGNKKTILWNINKPINNSGNAESIIWTGNRLKKTPPIISEQI
ncbi:PAS domain S-box protein [Methanoplanus limicola]|uniref:histidine kinase n=1 Tax=Methanoplanus limicola DSM 2279 TaxID=937775 RepID=H1YZ74_9EURY|nr:PAS domain S-box protein [Methanoplanus limicola]EHQ34303.1 putative PAS/PAC sensor protein [Methanoplanus limicola DSM 2279]